MQGTCTTPPKGLGLFLTRRAIALQALAAATMTGRAALAQTPPTLVEPTGPVILTISGKIGVFNRGQTAVFDRAMIEALGTTSFETQTPWYDKPQTFEGVLMTKLLDAVKANGDRVVCTALNDYSTEIPIADFAAFGTIMAFKRGGTYLTVRDKGPLFIIYPFDSNPELRQQRYYGRSAWQLAQLSVR
jgi:hypothetical protein